MSYGPTTKKSSWPLQSAIVVSNASNMHMLLRELLRNYSWTVTESTDSVDVAISAVRSGAACLVIVDDTADLPAVNQLRHLLKDPYTAITPTLTFTSDQNRSELPALQKLGRPEVVEKPLTPSKFVPGFLGLIRRWEDGPFLQLRLALYQFLAGNMGSGLRSLAKLSEIHAIQTLCAIALSIHLRNMGKMKQAETVMLASLKQAPRDLGALVGLGDLYLHAAMPKLAHRLFAGARNAYPGSMAPFPDLTQSALMMGQVDAAITYLYTMYKAGYRMDITPNFLARLLYSEGREDEAEKVLNSNRASFNKILSAWNDAELSNMPAA